MIEADLWPNRIAACRKLGIPSALLNARLSRRSESRFRRARFFTAPFFNQLHLITLTEEEDTARWLTLGVDPHLLHWTGNIKYEMPQREPSDELLLPSGLGWSHEDPLLLAASTHEGEEMEIAKAFLTLRHEHPLLRLVIAPRHVERRASILSALQTLGLSVSLRSMATSSLSDILLLDTTGELSHWYSLATVVFVGKSLACAVHHGGQNMIEPLQNHRPVVIGPHTENFEPLASHLCAAGAALRVSDAASLVSALQSLLVDSCKRQRMIQAAEKILEPHQGSTLRTCEFVKSLLR
jgi:3-deoxy-D-manno-octulosonic-acid transferase